MKTPRIIGLGHYRRTGKTTLARMIVTAARKLDPDYQVAVRSLADKLKDIAHQLYGWAGLKAAWYYEEHADEREQILPAIGKSPRQIWIDLGTHAIRDRVYARTWIDYLLARDTWLDGTIIPDVRFYDEVTAIRKAGGLLVKVVRPGYEPGEDAADSALIGWEGWDEVVGHGGTLAELEKAAEEYAKWLISSER